MPKLSITSTFISDEIDFSTVVEALQNSNTSITLSLPNTSDYLLIRKDHTEYVGYKAREAIILSYVEDDQSVASEYFDSFSTLNAVQALRERYKSETPWLPSSISSPFDEVFQKI